MLKPVSKQLLVNIVAVVLIVYLALAVQQLRSVKCTDSNGAPVRGASIWGLDAPDGADVADRQNDGGNDVRAGDGGGEEDIDDAGGDLDSGDEQEEGNEAPSGQQKQQQPENDDAPAEKEVSQAQEPQSVYARPDAVARRARDMPACVKPGQKAKSFLMVFMGHSGSSAILSELRGHSQVHVEGAEPVDHQKTFNTTEALEIARGIFDRGIAAGKTPGFKIRPAHIIAAPEAWAKLREEYDSRIVWQYRKNVVKSAIGEYTHRFLNDTSVVEGLRTNMTAEERCKIGAGCSFKIEDFDFLHGVLKTMMNSQKLITDAVHLLSGDHDCVRELPYEDYLYEREHALADVQRFLGLNNEPTEPLRFKATGDNMCDVVENWDELCTNFYGCLVWQHMLDDPRNECFCPFSSGPTKYCAT